MASARPPGSRSSGYGRHGAFNDTIDKMGSIDRRVQGVQSAFKDPRKLDPSFRYVDHLDARKVALLDALARAPTDRASRFYFSGLFCFSTGITDLPLSGIASRPWSPLESLPPDVDVPLPLLFGAMPVVSLALEAELAAGRGVPGFPALLWAYAKEPDKTKAVAKNIEESFMRIPSEPRSRETIGVAECSERMLLRLSSPLDCDAMGPHFQERRTAVRGAGGRKRIAQKPLAPRSLLEQKTPSFSFGL